MEVIAALEFSKLAFRLEITMKLKTDYVTGFKQNTTSSAVSPENRKLLGK